MKEEEDNGHGYTANWQVDVEACIMSVLCAQVAKAEFTYTIAKSHGQ